MLELSSQLESLRATPGLQSSFSPEMLNLQIADDHDRLTDLISSGQVLHAHDTLMEQLEELFALRYIKRNTSTPSLDEFRQNLLEGTSPQMFGTWCYYPWTRCLVHVLPHNLFHEVRTNRNCHKISASEQQILCTKCIAVVGLSVGSAIATTMAMEGVGGSFRLADFDTLSLSNLNRINASIGDLGTNKCLLTARRMTEINPYLNVTVFTEGIRPSNIDTFLVGGGTADLIVEECDDIEAKFLLRSSAKCYGIPVIMETSDRGLLDIERFDREPDRPMFHGLVDNLDVNSLTSLSTEQKLPIIFKLLDGRRLSVSAQASLLEIGQTISTWPQLASSVVLGGGTVTDVARRILLDKLQQSGRFYVDVESIVCDFGETETIECHEDIAFPPSLSTSTEETIVRIPHRSSSLVVSKDEYRWLIAQAILAPSGGNSQPWRFECGDNQIIGFRDPSRRSPLLDFDFRASDVALGGAAENIDLAARVLGLKINWDYFPRGNEGHCVFVSRLERCEEIDVDPLHAQIAERCTNRKQSNWKPLSSSNANALQQEASLAGAKLHIIDDQEALTNIGELIGRVDRLRFFSQPMHTELIQELRWTEQEVVQTRDGIDIATLELTPGERAVMELFRSWPAMERLKQVQGGGGFVQAARQSVEKSSAICLLRMPGKGRQRFFLGGRALQRVWLRATALGLAIQPMSVLVYLLNRLEDGRGCGLGAEEQDELREIGYKFNRIVGMQSDHADILLFRLFLADPPAIRAIRRDVSCISDFSKGQS